MRNYSFITAIVLSLLASTQVVADNSKRADERLGGYTLADESMLGRYGDVNDEWVQSSSVAVKAEPVRESSSPKKSVGKLGGYSLEDQSMLGRYGDHNDE